MNTPRLSLNDVPKFPSLGSYRVDVALPYLASHVAHYVDAYALDMDPPFQRAHVWTHEQQVAFVEYFLRGGMSGRDIYVNHTNWRYLRGGQCVLVDGKQRLEALLSFVDDDLTVFGGYRYSQIDGLRSHVSSIRWNVNDLPTMDAAIEWYVYMNARGTPHTEDEIAKAQAFIGTPYAPTLEEIRERSRPDRPSFVKARAEEAARDAETAARSARLDTKARKKRASK